MRISTGMIFDAGVSSINKQTSSLLHLQQQVASGRRILSPSDDPVAAARALEVTQSQDVTAQFKLNHNNANSALGLEEAQLSSASDLLARIRELAVQGANSTLGTDERSYIAGEMRELRDHVDNVARTTAFNGTKLLDGSTGAGGTPASMKHCTTAAVLAGVSSAPFMIRAQPAASTLRQRRPTNCPW